MALNGKELLDYTRALFKTSEVTPEQLDYVLTMLSPVNYLLKHHKVKGHGITFNIPDRDEANKASHRPWQTEIIRATVDPNIKESTVIKSRQLGLSEVGLASLIYFCDKYSFDAVKALYTFPTNKQLKDFIKSRINPQFTDGYYSTLVDKDNDSLDQKSIRNSRIFFRSSSKPGAVEGVDIDIAMLDEYDRVNAEAENSALESMSSSDKYGLMRRWSTPTVTDYGIDKKYKQSDQQEWHIPCDHCGKYQVLDFEKNIELVNKDGVDILSKTVREGSYRYVCQFCHQPLDRWYGGVWSPRYTVGNRSKGFRITQLDAIWIKF